MAAALSISMSLNQTGAGPNALDQNLFTYTGTSSTPNGQSMNVAVGTNTLLPNASGIPTSPLPTYMVLEPPSGNSNTLTLKGATTDTGSVISPTLPTMIALPATGAGPFYLNASSATVVRVTFG